jgi:hypothetical protein
MFIEKSDIKNSFTGLSMPYPVTLCGQLSDPIKDLLLCTNLPNFIGVHLSLLSQLERMSNRASLGLLIIEAICSRDILSNLQLRAGSNL